MILKQSCGASRGYFLIVAICLAMMTGAISRSAKAAVDTWLGNDPTAIWSDGANWTGGNSPPLSGDSLVFGGAGSNGTTLTDDLTSSAFQITGITFNAGGSAFIINGNAIGLNGGITDTFVGTETDNQAIDLQATDTISVGTGTTASTLVLGGNISSGSGTFGLNFVGGSTTAFSVLFLTGTNTYTGGTSVSGGILSINSDAALGATSGALTFATNNSTLRAGAGLVTLGASRSISISSGVTAVAFDTGANTLVINSNITAASGPVTLTKLTSSTGMIVLGGNNSFVAGSSFQFANTTAGTTIDDGILRLTSSNALGSNAFTLDNDSGNNGNTVDSVVEFSGGITIGSNVTYFSRTKNSGNPMFRNISGNNTYAGTFDLSSSGGLGTVESADPNGTFTMSGPITTGPGPSGATGIAARSLMFSGNGNGIISGVIQNGTFGLNNVIVSANYNTTWTFTAANTFASGTSTFWANGGTSIIDYNAGGLLPATTSLTMDGGNFTMKGNSSGATAQTFVGSFIIGGSANGNLGGGGTIAINPNGGGGTTLTLPNTWTRNAGGTVHFDLSQGTLSSPASVSSNPTTMTNGIFGFATVNDGAGIGFATINSGAVARYTGATPLTSAGNSATTNFSTSGALIMAGTFAANSLAIDTSGGAGSLDLGAPANVMTVTTGGLLFTGANDFNITDGIVKSGTATNSDLIINQWGAGKLTISAVIANGTGASTLTKSGSGTLILGTTNTYTGRTFINGGTISMAADNLGATTSPVTFNGGILQATGSFSLNAGHAMTINSAGAIFDVTGSNNLTVASNLVATATGVNGNTGNSPAAITKLNTGTLTLTGTNSYAGGTFINAGTLIISSDGNLGATLQGAASGPGVPDINIIFSGSSTLQSNATALSLNVNRTTLIDSGVTANLIPLTGSSTNSFTLAGAITSQSSSGNLAIGNGTTTGSVVLTSAASTYTVPTTINSGTLTVSFLADGGNPSSIGASTNAASNLVFNGNNTELNYTGATTSTNRNFTINSTIGTPLTAIFGVSTAATRLTMSGTEAAANNASLTKVGLGTLVFTGTHTYTGATTVSAGTLLVNGSLSASSAVSVSGTIGGTGSVGALTINSGGTLSPGDPLVSNGVSTTFAPTSLTFANGSLISFDFNTGSALSTGHDIVTVSNANGLAINGGALSLILAGTAGTATPTPFATNGTYDLFNYTTGFTGLLSNLSIANAQSGKSYNFVNNTSLHEIQLTIGTSTSGSWTNGSGNELWTNSANWVSSSIPNSQGATANFSTDLIGGDGVVQLNGGKTVGGLVFNNGVPFDLIGTTANHTGSTLTVDNASAGASINVLNGTHTIEVPMALNSSAQISTATNTSLTISGAISTSTGQGVSVSGTGVVILTGNNSYTTTTVGAGATLAIGGDAVTIGAGGTSGTLGTGNVTLGAGANLIFNRSDSALNVASNILSSGNVLMNGSGAITLSGANSYASLAVNSGTVNLNNASALPSGAALTVGNTNANLNATLNLNGNNASVTNFSLPIAGAVVTDNSATPGVTSLSVAMSAATDILGQITKGTNRDIALTIAAGGNTVTFDTTSVNTYGGGTTVNSGVINVLNNSGLGTGPITVNGPNTGSPVARLQLHDGVTLTPNIVINTVSPGTGLGALTTDAISLSGTATFSGSITINAATGNGGDIVGPGAGLLSFTGPITTGSGVAALVVRGGNVQLSGGGSYPQISITGNDTTLGVTGVTSIGANNGIAPNAVAALGVSGNGTLTTLDLNGFNQTLASIVTSQSNSTANTSTITNSSTTSASILTLAPTATTNASFATNTATVGTASITDSDSTHPLSVVLNGDPAGIQQFLVGTGGGFTYHGSTTLTSGTLVVDDIENGGSSSSIGASDSTATNLVFNGGTLQLTGATSRNTDRNFTMNDGKTATIDVVTAGASLTLNGNATVSGTESSNHASFSKPNNPGAIIVNGTMGYHGNTTIGGGMLQVNGTLGAAGSTGNISVASSAVLNGTGSINGVLNHNVAGAIISGGTHVLVGNVVSGNGGTLTFDNGLTLNGGTVRYYVDQSNSSTQDLINVAGAGLTIGASITPLDMELQNPNSTSPATFQYTLFTLPSTETSIANLANLQITSSNGGRTGFSPISLIAGGPTGRELVTTVTFGSGHDLDWNSTSDSNWDTTHANWFDTTSSLNNQTYFQGDNVHFVDNNTHPVPGGQLQTAIALNTTVTPGSVTYNASTNNYTISGIGKISGAATLSVGTGTSTGTLILETNNDYSGTTTVNSGTLNIGGGTASGSLGTGSLQINSPGNLIYSRSDSTTFAPTSVSGNGNLIFAGTNNVTAQNADLGGFGGTLTVQSGIVRPANTNNPLSGSNNIVQNGGELYFDTGSNHAPSQPITINGTGTGASGANNDGAIRVGAATTTTVSGTVTVGSNALVGLDGGATLALTNSTALSGTNTTLSVTGGGTLSISGDVNLGATGGIVTVAGSNIQFAPNAGTTINVNSPLTGAGPLTITTAGTGNAQGSLGTTVLNVDSPSYTGNMTIGNGSGNLEITTGGALGSPTTGTFTIGGSTNNTNLVGTLLLNPTSAGITVTKPMSLGARQGNGINVFHIQNVAGNNILSGAITLLSGGSDYNLDSDAGSLTIQSQIAIPSALTTLRNVKLSGAGNGTLAGGIADSAAGAGMMNLVKSGSGTWTIGTASSVRGGLTLNDTGTLSTGGHNLTFSGNTATPGTGTTGTLNLASGTPTIDLSNGSSILTFDDSSAVSWSGSSLAIANWTFGNDALYVSKSSVGLNSTQLSQIDFTGFAPGAQILGDGEVQPLGFATLLGDVNLDSHVDSRDLIALMSELINTAGYLAAHPALTNAELLAIADVNHDGKVNNIDEQALINYLLAGHGSNAPVPEPASFLLLALGGLAVGGRFYRRKRRAVVELGKND
ncbi:MAG TPA: autotransporter-associated beta strand repeat-containing protein [Pirellulales bacterium]|jgi:autotransporter-associated beta strand protein|nr:autotransporter-associated beta strand repeat-containing protein [Pirellulales bacterium]